MNLFASEIVTPPTHLPITVTASQTGLAESLVDEIEKTVLWRGIVRQTRRIVIDGPLPILELEPVASIVSITRWTKTDPAEVIDPASYSLTSRDPGGALIAPLPGHSFPAPMRPFGSFSLTYWAGWTVTATENLVPPSIKYMLTKAIEFRSGSGLGDIELGSLKMSLDNSYKTDRLPEAIASIGRGWAYRPGLFASGR